MNRDPNDIGLVIMWLTLFAFAIFGVWAMSELADFFMPIPAYRQEVW